jgi:hypothetical protein
MVAGFSLEPGGSAWSATTSCAGRAGWSWRAVVDLGPPAVRRRRRLPLSVHRRTERETVHDLLASGGRRCPASRPRRCVTS